MTKPLSRVGTPITGFDDDELDFQLLRQLGTAANGASVGETLASAASIRQRGPDSWTDVWAALADRQRTDAEGRAGRKHLISARDQFLRACSSYRAAEYFSPNGTARHAKLGLASRAAFAKAMELMDHGFEPVSIEVAGLDLPGYYFTPADDARTDRLLVAVSGFDGTLEETYLQIGPGALARGWQLLLVAGPGQMDTARACPDTFFVPDAERWMSRWLDVGVSRTGVDPMALALLGISVGGYFVLRAAANDDRVAAVVANSPITDLHAYDAAFVGPDPETLMGPEDDFGFDDVAGLPDDEVSPAMKDLARGLIHRFGQSSFLGTFRYLKQFSVDPGNVVCPVLAMIGDGEGAEPRRQFDDFCARAGGPVSRHVFTAAEGAEGHCQVGNLAYAGAVLFDWLDEMIPSPPMSRVQRVATRPCSMA